MVDMSDILKRIKEKKKEEKKTPLVPPKEPKEGVSFKFGPREEGVKEEKKPQEPRKPELRLTPAVRGLEMRAGEEKSAGLYKDAVSLIENIMKAETDIKSVDINEIINYVKTFITQLSMENDVLLELVSSVSNNSNYLLAHSVNVCILSIKLGIALGYDKRKLEDLGVSAFLHDIGMKEYKEIASRPGKLSRREYDKIKKHPVIGSEMLKKLTGVCKEAIRAAHQQHERIDGSGYPQGLKGEDISEFAKIIGVIDVYEAMTHFRPYRSGYVSFDALKTITGTKDLFEKRLVKMLINIIGLYPIGSYVQLSTGEKAKVVKINRGMPLRPAVEVIYGSEGEKLEQSRQLNLLQHPTLYIKKPLEKEPE